MKTFEPLNRGYQHVFQPNQLSIGVVVPIENYAMDPVPSMQNHLQRVQLVEELGYKAIWIRDVPLHVPTFGDAGQTYDPFTYLGYLAAATKTIGLGVASIALPLHHPMHVAKSAATIDQLSGGRLLLGVASGDRPQEYPAMGIGFQSRGERFRDAFDYIRAAADSYPVHNSTFFGELTGQHDILPKPTASRIPMLITGNSRQSMDWIAAKGDGWMFYPQHAQQQAYTIARWRRMVQDSQEFDQPFMQPLYVDLHKNDDFRPQPIHLGFRAGANYLLEYFQQLKDVGVNHVAINLRFNGAAIEETLERLAEKILPYFHTTQKEQTTI